MVQLIFGHDITIPIKHEADFQITCHKNQAQMNKDNIHENKIRVDYNYKVGTKVMFTKL